MYFAFSFNGLDFGLALTGVVPLRRLPSADLRTGVVAGDCLALGFELFLGVVTTTLSTLTFSGDEEDCRECRLAPGGWAKAGRSSGAAPAAELRRAFGGMRMECCGVHTATLLKLPLPGNKTNGMECRVLVVFVVSRVRCKLMSSGSERLTCH